MLTLNAIAALTEDVARTFSLQIEIAGVTGGAHGGEYAEVLLTVLDREGKSSRLMVGVSRIAPGAEVREIIAGALLDHANRR